MLNIKNGDRFGSNPVSSAIPSSFTIQQSPIKPLLTRLNDLSLSHQVHYNPLISTKSGGIYWGINSSISKKYPHMNLNDKLIKNAKPKEKQYKLADGLGMYLLIETNGSKYWRLKYRINQKEKTLALGTYPETSLKEAREKREEARKQLAEGLDPSQEKKLKKLQRNINNQNNFESIAREWHSKQTERWTPRHASYVIKRLEADIFKYIGERPIAEITTPELLNVLQKIEKRGAIDIAHRALQTCGQIFRFGIATGVANRDLSSDLKGALTTRKKTNYARLQENEVPEFLNKLEKYDGELQTKLALKFLMLTFVRTNELRGARWDEFNFETNEWHIPAPRMKMRQKHIGRL